MIVVPSRKESHYPHPQPLPTRGRGALRVCGAEYSKQNRMCSTPAPHSAGRERRIRASDGAARLGRPHFVSAPDEAAAETAADPQQRQEDVTQDKGRGRSKT